jgi:hypothetical protein
MKTSVKSSGNCSWPRLLALFVALGCVAGCTTSDPVRGWKCWYANLQPPNQHSPGEPYYHIDQAIIDDYQDFVERQKLKNPTLYVAEVYFYEDGAGQHAVKLVVETGLRKYVEYFLMYDKANLRTKVIKGKTWHQFHI